MKSSSQQPSTSSSLSTTTPALTHVGNSLTFQEPNSSNSVALLGTATVRIKDRDDRWHHIRCIIDPGSQISIISERVAQVLKLPRKYSSIQISGIGAAEPMKAKGFLTLESILIRINLYRLNV